MKKSKVKPKEWHTSKSQVGSGDHYGQGIRNPVGRMRSDAMINPAVTKKLGKPPKTLA